MCSPQLLILCSTTSAIRCSNLLPLGEQFVERETADDDISQCGLGILGDGKRVILDFDDGLFRIGNQEEQDSIDRRGHVILGNHLLARNVKREQPQINESDVVHKGDDIQYPGSSNRKEFAQPEHDTTFPLGRHTHAGDEDCPHNRKCHLGHGRSDHASLVHRPQCQEEYEAEDDDWDQNSKARSEPPIET